MANSICTSRRQSFLIRSEINNDQITINDILPQKKIRQIICYCRGKVKAEALHRYSFSGRSRRALVGTGSGSSLKVWDIGETHHAVGGWWILNIEECEGDSIVPGWAHHMSSYLRTVAPHDGQRLAVTNQRLRR